MTSTPFIRRAAITDVRSLCEIEKLSFPAPWSLWCFLATNSQDQALLEAFRQGQDIHRTTAALVHGIDIADAVLQLPVTAEALVSGPILRRRDIGAGQLGQFSDQGLAGLAGRQVTAVDQQVAVG